MSIYRLWILITFIIIGTACSGSNAPESADVTGVIDPTLTPTIVLTNQATPVITVSLSVTPMPIQDRIECPDAPPTRLIIQDRGRVTDDNNDTLNLREGPSINFDIIARLEPLDMFLVLEGPTCADGFSWYRVRAGTRIGWIAEGDNDLYYVEPHLTG